MKRKCLAGLLVLAMAIFLAVPAMAVGDGYLKIDGVTYKTPEELRRVTDNTDSVVGSGDVIEVYGEVDLPLIPYYINSEKLDEQYTWVLKAPNVTISGMTDDAVIYSSTPFLNGMGDGQQTILVMSNGVTIENLSVLPNYYTNTDTKTNKTIEVRAQDFTIKNVTIRPNDKVAFTPENPQSSFGGALYFNGAGLEGGLKNLLVEDNDLRGVYLTFDSAIPTDNIRILRNTFTAPADVDSTFYFIGNNTWATPMITTMGGVLVAQNTFQNMPDGFKTIVKHRMTGTFTLLNNKTDDGLPVRDRVTFETYRNSDNVSDGKGKIIVTENGRTYHITIKDVADPESISIVQLPAMNPELPNIGDIPDVEAKLPEVKSVGAGATSEEIAEAKAKLASELTGFTAEDFDVNEDGQIIVRQESIAQAALSVLGENEVLTSMVSLPVITTEVSAAGKYASIAFILEGSTLKSSTPADVRVLKVKSATDALFMSHVASPADYHDGAFAIFDAYDKVAEEIMAGEIYKLILFIQDNGDYDLNPAEMAITDPVAVVESVTETPAPGGGSSSGCNVGIASALLLLLAPLAVFRKK